MNVTPRLSFTTAIERFGPEQAVRPAVVVAVPVKDEEDRIADCLASLAGQEGIDLGEVALVLLLNNCRDGTADRVRELAPQLPFAVHLHTVELPDPYANAGWARRLGMEAAAELARPDGVILTTDADTLVDTDWIEANLREIARGVDAVAGYVMADPMELMELPSQILERGALEWEYQQLAAELVARADPEPHDTWPRHNQNCGASAAITVAAYRRIGGLPPKRVGEDRALFEMLRRIDGKVRHSLEVQVVTSARTDGRACGGLSDAIRLRGDPEHPCDEMLELAMVTVQRALWRNRLRQAWDAGRLEEVSAEVTRRLRLAPRDFQRAVGRRHFGEFWAEVERLSPRLKRRLVTGAGLKRELRRMRRLVESARARPAPERAWIETAVSRRTVAAA